MSNKVAVKDTSISDDYLNSKDIAGLGVFNRNGKLVVSIGDRDYFFGENGELEGLATALPG
uniref:Uncharacterized protein n=1 Tax=viral metagenome TaxID=1070528 RepID=A0A6M3XE02_9ZZZZ